MISRVGHATFAVFCPGLDGDVAQTLAGRLQAAVAEPIDAPNTAIKVTASTGIATRGRGERTSTLLEHADLALQAARSAGSAETAIYDGVVRKTSEDRRTLASELVNALAENQLATAFEPIVHLPQGSVVGVEAHVLWNHPTRGQIDRADFMDLAELIGRVDDVERAVLEFAIEQDAMRERKVRTGFNVSASTLRDPVAVGWIVERLSGDDHKIIVEVAERAFEHSMSVVCGHLVLLRDAGASIVLDDFGLGTASLRALHAFQFDGVKMHGSLISNGSNSRARAILDGVYASAAAAGFDVIHTGVNTDEDLRQLVALCRPREGGGFYAQGRAVRARVAQATAA